ncbi:50S ribosomal protein L4 [Phytophthora infestans T30-4]|uniref:Large ribosomal subunit protein uL4m n=2 Tax=Phytophthora infestans TaxID=4787 RepID=D0MYG7_PHYIT|nr:50S ribosomal protein L4 [Phytophthora infestans T30-4]EEY66215.1 50S ribosomal protein L4 [Phytophthora infestans T30-4]KAF4040554.1 Ribosomal protein L4/L1 family [Phytophthora infestans]KAF4135800.1 Ribosomal protein L4/L1 family [Phytophthora infestans]|eukprot:XP_002906814.1 50S ribosomal protein L4 [Phytophthora infestans T30-4]
MATVSMNRLMRGIAALNVSAPRASLVRAASTQVAAMPANLSLAEEKPMPPPRVIPAAQEVKVTSSGDLELKMLSLAEDTQDLGSISMDGEVFGAPDRVDILQRVVRWQLACRRAGTNKTKTRSEVSGSTRKPWKQKGSGRARVGDIRAPQWRGGYRVHGPVLRDFSYSLPKKVRAMGLRVALSTKLREGKLAIVDSLDVDITKTKDMKKLLGGRGWDHALFVGGEEVESSFVLATRNIPHVDTLAQNKINVYSILQKDLLIITKDAVKYLEERLHVD